MGGEGKTFGTRQWHRQQVVLAGEDQTITLLGIHGSLHLEIAWLVNCLFFIVTKTAYEQVTISSLPHASTGPLS